MRIVLIILFSCLLGACKKNETETGQFSESTYKFTITGLWQTPQFSVPPSAHFTYFVGLIHDEKTSIWREATLASPGIEAVAEVGNALPLSIELDSLVANKKAIAVVSIPPPSPTGNISRSVYFNSNFSHISFVSMIAPSPDWFVGVKNLNLYRNDQWLDDTTVQLYVYDAGTEDGDVFAYNNPATVPQQPIQLLTPAKGMVLANGNPSLAPIAQVRITKQ